MHTATEELRREGLLDEVIATYLDDTARGTAPPRQQLLLLYPDLAAELEQFFQDRDNIDRLAAPFRVLSAGGARPRREENATPSAPSTRAETPLSNVDCTPSVGTPILAASSRKAGDQLWPEARDYEIQEELGRGGMGVVFKARQLSLNRPVALKMMRGGPTASREERARFRQEAEAVARLQHPNIVQIYEVGEHDGFPFICFEFVDGGSLHRRLAGEPMPVHDSAQLVETLARAVHYAHQHGIIHRDLKPANILLDCRLPIADGRSAPAVASHPGDSATSPGVPIVDRRSTIDNPKITDFGLAKRLDEELGQTASGAIVGTPCYMAPEQAGGRSKDVGPAADVYSLGATLYEMVTGRPPFKAASTMDTVLLVLQADPIPPQRLVPTCPRDLETIILKCLRKDPHKRYASADALADDLRRFRSGEPIEARPAGVWERTIKWARRRPAVAALAAAVSLAALLLVGLVVGYNVHLQNKVEAAIGDVKQAQSDKERAEQIAADAVKEKRLTGLQAECGQLLVQAETALKQKRLDVAKSLAFEAQVKSGEEPALADVKRHADEIAVQAQRLLTARENLRLLIQGRDDALFHLYRQMFTGLDVPDSLNAAGEAAGKALDLFQVATEADRGPVLDDSYTDREREQVRLGCYELLLILAEATAREGQPATDARTLRRAVAILDRARLLFPSTRSKSYHLRRARYLTLLGEESDARKERGEAAALKPVGSLDAFLVGVDRWLVEGKPGEAAPYIEQAQRGQDDVLWAPFFLAITHLRSQQPAQAKAYLTVFINRNQDFVWAYLFRGSIHGELGEFDAAEADFDRADGLAKDDDWARYVIQNNRGVMRIRQKRYGAAIADIQAAIKLQPRQFHAYLSLATVYRDQRKWDAAVEQLSEAIRRKSDLALLYRERAQVHLLREDLPAALDDFERGIAAEPLGDLAAELHLQRGLIYYHTQKYPEAVQACATALLLRDDFPAAYRWTGEALLAMNKHKEAIQAFDRYLVRGAPAAEVFHARAQAWEALGEFAAAIDDYGRALTLKPNDAALQAARGWAYLVNDVPKLALRDFEAAIERDRNNGDAHNGRGYARVRQGRIADAIGDAREAVRLGPKNARTHYNAARIISQAAGVTDRDADQPYARRVQTAATYRDEALDRLTEALQSLRDDAERVRFWQKYIRSDGALNPIRPSQRFRALADRYEHTSQR